MKVDTKLPSLAKVCEEGPSATCYAICVAGAAPANAAVTQLVVRVGQHMMIEHATQHVHPQ